MKKLILLFPALIFQQAVFSQTGIQQKDSLNKDTTSLNEIDEITINGKKVYYFLPDIQGTSILAGKKSEVIQLSHLDADLSTNNTRQLFGKVPGISIWENDGSGIQVGIAARGLSPNRSWEFNVRQNGYDISSEAFGYPEAYYSPPMEALEKIEIIRGAASLQYGTQFGGLLNYVVKKKLSDKPFSFESSQTIGSNGLMNTYNAIGGTIKKFSYFAYMHYRTANGWRDNSNYFTKTGFVSMSYAVNNKMTIGFEYSRMNSENQQAGGLTDSMFKVDPTVSLRSRNWMSTPWNVSALTFNYNVTRNSKLEAKFFSTIGERNSVGFTKSINVADTFNTLIRDYNTRQVDRDSYNNLGAEIRFIQAYRLFGQKNALSIGVRAYTGSTKRRQQGIGTSGHDYNLQITQLNGGKEWGKDLSFMTKNLSAFAENMFQLTKRFSLIPGIRFEHIVSTADGYINTSSAGVLENQERTRTFLLAGVGAQFIVSKASNLYANFSQGFRPVTYSELTPSATTETIDPNLKDANGYNVDFGYRGSFKNYVDFDAGIFFLQYNDRIGSYLKDGNLYKTNIGASQSKGIETFVEIDPINWFTTKSKVGNLKLFVNYSLIDAVYTEWNNPAIINDPLVSIEGKRVENAPQNIMRLGASYKLRSLSLTIQMNQVDDVYTDAVNTELPNATATIGKLEGYTVIDLSATYVCKDKFTFKSGINNLTDEMYATRRATGYPGPGILPGNGRTFYFTVGVKL
jgi:Fe(3+) dicitrate transport protein